MRARQHDAPRPRRGARPAAALAAALVLGLVGGAPAGAAVGRPADVVAPTADPAAPWPGLAAGPGTSARRADGDSWRVLVAGDSLSRGVNGDVTWRQRLWAELRRQGQPVVMVGPRTGSTTRNGAPVWWANPAFGAVDHHDALGGTTIAVQRPYIGARVAAAQPDVVCVLLGLNDLRNGFAPATVVARMQAYLSEVLRSRPRATVVLGPLTDTVTFPDGQLRAGDTASVNAGYADLVRRLQAGGYDAHWADPAHAAWTPRQDSYDGTHPSPRGEQVLLRRFGAALHEAGVLPSTPPAPAASVPWVTGVVGTPQVARRVATISWGAWVGRLSTTRMLVRVTGPGGSVRTLTSGVAATSLRVRLPRGYYRVQVAPKRNWLEGAYGPARSFRVR